MRNLLIAFVAAAALVPVSPIDASTTGFDDGPPLVTAIRQRLAQLPS